MTADRPMIGALMDKAAQALRSSRMLIDAGDADGGCSRAYYAMFDAARAVLLHFDETGSDDLPVRTHRGVIGSFGERLVRKGLLPGDLGRLLKRAETARTTADYRETSVDLSDAGRIVDDAEIFVAAIEELLKRGRPGDGESAST